MLEAGFIKQIEYAEEKKFKEDKAFQLEHKKY